MDRYFKSDQKCPRGRKNIEQFVHDIPKNDDVAQGCPYFGPKLAKYK